MSINEQIENLRRIAKEWNPDTPINPVSVTLNQAADTIESLSAKLQAVNMERPANDCRKSVLKINTPQVCIDCPCHFAGESGMVMCGVEKRELLSDDIQTYKPEWCPLKESAEDCGGWIPCKEKLPEDRQNVIVSRNGETLKYIYEFHVPDEEDYEGECGDTVMGYLFSEYDAVIGIYSDDSISVAWQPLPDPYHEP